MYSSSHFSLIHRNYSYNYNLTFQAVCTTIKSFNMLHKPKHGHPKTFLFPMLSFKFCFQIWKKNTSLFGNLLPWDADYLCTFLVNVSAAIAWFNINSLSASTEQLSKVSLPDLSQTDCRPVSQSLWLWSNCTRQRVYISSMLLSYFPLFPPLCGKLKTCR